MSDQSTDPYAAQPAYPPAPPAAPAYAPPTAATTAQQPAYSSPVSAAPAYPVSGYPPPPAPRRTSVWTWFFAGLTVLLLAGGGGAGYMYNKARTTVVDRNNQIATLQSKVDSQAKDLTTSEGKLKDAQDDLKDANDEVTALEGCKAAVQKFVDSLDGTDAASEAAALAMFNACDSDL